MDNFWRTAEGETTRLYRRRSESLRVTVTIEPPTKNSRPGTQRKAREAIEAAFETDILAQHARKLTNWPKPRASIALDVAVFSAAKNPPRVDNVCKWLLDELAGKVYADDRQVKLLFARMWKPSPSRPEDDDLFWGESGSPSPAKSVERSPKTYITARTRASVLADLRAASNMEERWEPFDDDHGVWSEDPVDADFYRETLLDYQSTFDPNDEDQADRYHQLGHQIDYRDQAQQQRFVDLIFSSLLTDLPVDRFGIWNRVRNQLTYSPYLFDLGVLPERGESAAFRQRLKETLRSRRDTYPGLFPMRSQSGISMILFEEPRSGKDLDNLVQSVLPEILNVLRPPQHDLRGWIADEPDPAVGAVDIPFIEVAAIPADQADMPHGSVVFGLSSGHRAKSWWDHVGDYVERRLSDGNWV